MSGARVVARLGLLAGLATATTFGSAAAQPEPFQLPVPLTVRELRLESRDIAFDPHSGRIFASSGPDTRDRANSITALDPRTGAMEPPVFIGSDPGRLAVAPDGSNLYVVLEGAAAIARFDIRSRKPVTRFDIGSPHLEDMIVPAGHPNWVVAARQRPGYSPRHAGGSLFVDGRETHLYQWGPNVFIPTPDGERLYGIYNELGADKIGRRKIGPAGPGEPEKFATTADEGSQFLVEDGKLFSNSGRIYDFRTGELLGRCGRGGQFVAPQEKEHRAYYLHSAEKRHRFQVYDTRTFTPGDWLDISGVQGRITRLVKWGNDSYAFRTDAGQLFLIQPTAGIAPVAAGAPLSAAPTGTPAKPERGTPFPVGGSSPRPVRGTPTLGKPSAPPTPGTTTAPPVAGRAIYEASWGAVNEVVDEPGPNGARSRLSATLLLRNSGENATSRCGVRVFLADRDALTGKETPLQRTSVPPVRSLETFVVSLDVALPSGVSTSGRYLVAMLDRPAVDRESGQTRTRITVGPLP